MTFVIIFLCGWLTAFSSIMRPPPSSTLFPYTTLFRSHPPGALARRRGPRRRGHRHRRRTRSEEHTSELQSPCNIVCRLLLEKKKNKISTKTFSRTDHHVTQNTITVVNIALNTR